MPTVTPEPARPQRRDAAANRQRLITAASRVFGEHGTDASLETVAGTAGLNMATLYRRFPTKDGLVAEVVEVILGYIVDEARREAATGDGAGLRRWLWSYGRIQARKRGLVAHLLRDDRSTKALHVELTALLGRLVDDAKQHGTVRQDVTVSDIVLIMFSLQGVTQATRYGESAGWRRHLDLLLVGLQATSVELTQDPWTFRSRRAGGARRAG